MSRSLALCLLLLVAAVAAVSATISADLPGRPSPLAALPPPPRGAHLLAQRSAPYVPRLGKQYGSVPEYNPRMRIFNVANPLPPPPPPPARSRPRPGAVCFSFCRPPFL